MRRLAPLALSVLPAATLAEVPQVVTDIAPIHSLVAQVMAGLGEPDVLVTGGASPHDFQFNFDQAAAVQNADIVIWVGPSLTPWLDEALDNLGPEVSQLVLMDSDDWPKLELRTDEAFADAHDHGHDDHEEDAHDDDDHTEDDHHDHEEHADDVHGHEDHEEDAHDHDDHGDHAVDPHAWLDPQVAQVWVTHIAEALSAADPENEALYGSNAVAAITDLQALEAEVTTLLSSVPAGSIVVPHDAYQYFGARFDRVAVATIALDDASAPTPDRIAALKDRIADEEIDCVLSDPQARAEWSDLIREGSDAGSAIADPIGNTIDLGPGHYHSTLTALAAAYVECLGGE